MTTVSEVKELLPDVKIKYNGILFYGRVTGRKCNFACVSPYERLDGKNRMFLMGPIFQFSWDTIAHALNTDTPLLTD